MKFLQLTIITLFLSFLSTSSYAQENTSLDRVPEVEAELRKDVTEHISRFIPKQSFTVSVKVVPLKREPTTQAQTDVLPFYESSSESELYEEWEDPTTSYYVLLSRVKQVVVSLSVDKAYAIKNESDLRNNLFKSVGLISGRDQLDIKMVEMQSFSKVTTIEDFNWWYISGASILVILFILSFVILNKIVNPKSSSTNGSQANTTASTPSIMPAFNSTTASPSVGLINESNSINGDITFTDSLKLNSYLKDKIKIIIEKKSFPSLSFLKTLEEFLETDLLGFSYIMSQFPEDSKKLIYSYGRSQKWIKAFSQSGIATKNVLLYTDRLLQCNAISDDSKLEKMFIQAWRLNLQINELISATSQEEAKYILYHLPKSLSLPVTRSMFPGDWAFLFNDKINDIQLSDKRIAEIFEMCTRIRPLFQVELISFYTNQDELIKYLKLCSPEEERDIYQSYKGTPALHDIRPPFYSFFELPELEKTAVFKKFDIKSWALATFNISRELRAKIESIMNDKEKFLLKSYLIELDKNRPSQDQISTIREAIAQTTKEKLIFTTESVENLYVNEGLDEKAA